jgi:hypothetical protein
LGLTEGLTTSLGIPSLGYFLELSKACNLKRLFLEAHHPLDTAQINVFIKWLLRELNTRHQATPPRSKETASKLCCIHLRLRVGSTTDINAGDAGALSEVLSDDRNFPLLKEVVVVIVPHPEASKGHE